MRTSSYSILKPYLVEDMDGDLDEKNTLTMSIPTITPAIEANSYYFGHPEWGIKYFEGCHRDQFFKSRWWAAIDNWDDKIVIDIGCGAGNLYASLGGSPKLLIGVDVSPGALNIAKSLGYTPILADAHNLNLTDSFADFVVLNATLHHCENMEVVLARAARLVKPGGKLVTDHDPQLSAWNYKGLAMFLWNMRLPFYRLIKRGGHASLAEQTWGLAAEIHHKPGDGVTPELFYKTLEPLGFTVKLYPHNHTVGCECLEGNYGMAKERYRFAQLLSGINPDLPQSALSLMCIATRDA